MPEAYPVHDEVAPTELAQSDSEPRLPPPLHTMSSRNPLAILADIELDPRQGGLTEQLQLALGGHSSKICKIFSLMDKDSSLTVSKEEFSSVLLEHMELRCVDKQTIDILFDVWDTSRNGELTLEELEEALDGTADQKALFQHNLIKYDVGTGQEGRKPVAAAYWSGTIVFAMCVIAVTQAIAAFAWDDQDETSFPAQMLALPAHVLQTQGDDYKPSPQVSPTGWLSDMGFLRYSTLVLWLIVCVTGLGLEMVLGEPMVKSLMAKGNQSNTMQLWKGAQLLFSLAISVAIFSQSPFGLPWAVAGFWKAGFPETIGCFRRAFRLGTAPKKKLFRSALAAWLNGMGSLIHHCSGAYLVVCVATQLCPLDRRALAVSLPLVGQHLFVLLKYWSVPSTVWPSWFSRSSSSGRSSQTWAISRLRTGTTVRFAAQLFR